MTSLYVRFPIGWWRWLMSLLLLPVALSAQVPAQEPYRVRVVTLDGQQLRGTLDDVDEQGVYITKEGRPDFQFGRTGFVSIEQIRKVVVTRKQKRSHQVAGAIIGAVALGVVSNSALQRNQPRSGVTYGLTLTFSAAAGAAVGYALGSGANALFDQANRRVFRPTNPGGSTLLVQQLLPFCERYRQELFDRKPTINQPE